MGNDRNHLEYLWCFPVTSNPAPPRDDSSRKDAYLVLHRGARWSDVYRLAAPDEVVLGRSSENQVVLRSGRASRRHARLFFRDGDWFAEDLASRNGVFHNNRRLDAATVLGEGDRLHVAGFDLRFTYDLALGAEPHLPRTEGTHPPGDDQATQDDLDPDGEFAMEPDSEWLDIISRPANDSIGMPAPGYSRDTSPDSAAADLSLLQMAFAMGRLECPGGDTEPIAELLLQTLAAQLPQSEIGLYFFEGLRELPMPRHVRQRNGHRYRRPPESLVRQIRDPGASALLARNVVGDRSLATENTRGEIDVESIVMVPLHLPDSTSSKHDRSGTRLEFRPPDPKVLATSATQEFWIPESKVLTTSATGEPANGLLHIITTAGDAAISDRDLTRVIAACEIFCEACRTLLQRQRMQQTLTKSQQTITRMRKQLAGRVEILGKSDAIANVQYQIAQVARSGASVLLRGESGTGKELVASAIHFASPRADEPMICLNCAALSKDLLESELFGHEKGAFTGATDQKKGKFETASGGTLMLDEIGEMNLDLQSKLLRVLEGHPFERVGGQTPVRVDVRVIAATHRDLQAMVGEGTFRQDLFYRLNVIEMVVPPLRQRGQDIVLLARHFVAAFVQTMGRSPMKLSAEATLKLLDYSWPGNVRELRNVIERAVVMAPLDLSTTHVIGPEDLMLTRAVHGSPPTPPPIATPPPGSDTSEPTPRISLADLEQQHIERTLQTTGGNKSQAARILGIERSTLDRKLKRYEEN